MSFTVSPKSNFHVYNATGSYHQSPQMGEDFSNQGWYASGKGTIPAEEYDINAVGANTDISDLTGHPKGYWWQNSKLQELPLSLGSESFMEKYQLCVRRGLTQPFLGLLESLD